MKHPGQAADQRPGTRDVVWRHLAQCAPEALARHGRSGAGASGGGGEDEQGVDVGRRVVRDVRIDLVLERIGVRPVRWQKAAVPARIDRANTSVQ